MTALSARRISRMEPRVNLAQLLRDRTAALAHLGSYHGPIGELSPNDRQMCDAASELFRQCDAAIVDELNRLDRPVLVTVDKRRVELRLLGSRDGFAECDPQTGRPIYGGSNRGGGHLMLHQYPCES